MPERDFTKERDYNAKDRIVFRHDQICLAVYASLPKSSLTLCWFEGGGQVYIGRPFVAGQNLHRVSNYRFDYADSVKEFKELAQRFVEEAA